nr:restriction endonuclease subunit S [uncultured Cohaesibacter sp.]
MNFHEVKLGQLGELRNGLNYSAANAGTGLKVISVKNFGDRAKPDYSELDEINPSGLNIKDSLLVDGDIIFVRSNGNKDLIGRSMLVEGKQGDVSFSGFCIRFRSNTDATFPQFLAHYFRTPTFRKTLSGLGGGTNINNLNQKVLSNFPILLPDLPTQERIAGVLSAYDDLIENNRRRIALLEQAARLLYREWFVHFRFPGHETTKFVDGLPEGWSVGEISDLFNTSSGGTPSRKIESFYGGTINWLKTQELQNCFIFETDEQITDEAIKRSAAKVFPENTVVVAMYGATIGQLGILAEPSSTNQACCALLPKRDTSDYLYCYCVMEHSARALKDRGQGAAQNNVSQQVIKAMEVTIPSAEILDEFNSKVEGIFQQRKNLQRQIRKLAKARDLLLPRLMDGRIPV